MGNTISVCMVARDELPFLQKGIPLIRNWADQIVIVDTGSTDGSLDYLQTVLDPNHDVLVLAQKNTIPAHGFSFVRNVAAEQAKCDWIHSLDADEMLDFSQHGLIKDYLKDVKHNVVAIRTVTFQPTPGYGPTDWESIAANCQSHEDGHRRIYRRGAGIDWKGYIHEELYQGNRNCFGIHAESSLRHLHFSAFRNWGDPAAKDRRYCWMLLRGFLKKEYRQFTNHWWYESYVPENLEKIKKLAQEYVDAKYDYVEPKDKS